MKVLIVNTINYNINGIANVITSFCLHAKVFDSSIQIDVTNNGYIDEKYSEIFKNNNVKIIKLPKRKQIFKYIKALKRVVKQGAYDIVHIHGNSSTMILETFALKKCKAKVVVHCHNTKCNHMKIHKLLFKKFNNSYDYAVACSKEAGEFAFGKNFTVINNGLEVNKFIFDSKAREELRKQYNLQNKKVCLHVGLFNNQKNQEFLIRVASTLDDNYKFVFAGDGDNLQNCKELANSLNILEKVLFLGMQSDISKVYSMADCFVFPSNFESFGLALVEAQVNGLVCIVSDAVSRFSNVNKDLVTYLPLKENLWVDKLNNISIRTKTEQDMTMYNKFDISSSARQLIDFYNTILNKG